MLFNSIDFLVFFPIVVFLYFIIPSKMRYMLLLISSYYFYMSWNPKYAILIAISTIVTYVGGLLLNNKNNMITKQVILSFVIIVNLGILVIFKYSDFLISNINRILNSLHISIIEKPFDILLPVGISFYTFQALSYTIDIYRGTIQAEKNIFKYALFVSFFPQLVAGPIERSCKLLKQIQNVHSLQIYSASNIHKGLCLMLWGFFEKLVIADRSAILVNQVYNNYELYGFVEISFATILFAIQIYCDFDGYTNIARGAAKIMGFDLMKNFKQPYFATSIKDFWKRWHISLTSWFTDYVYIPLGGNRKGKLRTLFNIGIVFIVSGLWHGASWNYIFWGFLHGTYQIIELLIGNRKKKKNNSIRLVERIRNISHIIFTFVLVDFALLIFRSGGVKIAFQLISQSFTTLHTIGIMGLGLPNSDMQILLIAILILFGVDYCYNKNINLYLYLCKSPICIRYIIYQIAIWFVILFGVYGIGYDPAQFVYFQF